jgi:type IV fimbrial biogenesis protein FimT
MSKKLAGFTLIELMVTLSVLAILLAVAVPSFMSSMETNRISSYLQEASGAVRYTRSEAIKRNQSVTMCASSDQSTCTGNWNQGWIIFVDQDENGVRAASEQLLRVKDGFASGYAMTWSDTSSGFIRFGGQGYTANQQGTFKVCGKEKRPSQARGLVIQNSGSLRFAADMNSDGIPEDDQGNNLTCP